MLTYKVFFEVMGAQKQQFELLIEDILANGYAVCDIFLTSNEVLSLLNTFSAPYEAGSFKKAGIKYTNHR